ncbi:MAG: methyl-accepting chemotaxis protein [Pseudomonadota bacterium]
MFKNLTIRSRLIFILSFMSLLLVIIGGLGMFGMSQANEGLRTVYIDRTIALGQVSDVDTTVASIRAGLNNAVLFPTEENINRRLRDIEADTAKAQKIWASYQESFFTPEERALSDKFLAAWTNFTKEGFEPVMNHLRNRNIDEAKKVIQTQFGTLAPVFLEALGGLTQIQLDVAKSEYDQAVSRYETIRLITISATVIGLMLSVWLGFVLISAIVKPLNEAVEIANAVAAGDLTSRIEPKSNDETGHLLQALKSMNTNLVDLVGKVRMSADSITTGTGEIAAGNSDLSQRTEEQASSLEETASSMEELTSTVKQNAENAKQANQLAISASDIAVKGGGVVGEVVTTMSSINDSSKKIVDIISVIDGIAFQTNILALNAAVEAARAGEQGRGFAVVATEVRNLAQRSAAAAKEIKALISDSVEKVGNGTKLVDEAGKTMAEIVTSIKRVTDIMSEITAASQEQSAGIEQVNQAITQMDEVTQQNAALVEEAAAAAESLEEQAQNLVSAVAVFRTSEGSSSRSAGVAHLSAAKSARKAEPRKIAAAPAAQSAPAAKAKPALRKAAAGGGEEDWAEF